MNSDPAPENPPFAPLPTGGALPFNLTGTLRARLIQARHDLRNPLGEILGYSEMLQEEIAGTEHAVLIADLQIIHRTASVILKEVDHRLDLENERFGPHDCASLLETIAKLSDQIHDQASDLSNRCMTLPDSSVSVDLARIAGSARRLKEIAPQLLGGLEAYSVPTGIEEFQLGATSSDSDMMTDTQFFTRHPVPSGVHGTLLVVEDNESNRALLTRRLKRRGYKVVTAENGRRALELLGNVAFDLVMLDIMMPELDGYQVLQQMKADERLRHVPVIMISALDDLSTLVNCIQAGADDYLTKPFDPVLLSARIGACLEKKRLRDCEVRYLQQIEAEKQRSNDLLRVILPADIATELMAAGRVKPRRRERAAVMFCDVVGFTSYCTQHDAEEVIMHLQGLFHACEAISEGHGLEKIKTIGDCFMAASGVITDVENPTLDCVRAGLEIQAATRHLASGWQVRVGIHCGPVVAGVVGSKKYMFDIWGDTVNTAARVTGLTQAGMVCVSDGAWKEVAEQCTGAARGIFKVKGKGDMEIFQVTEASSLRG